MTKAQLEKLVKQIASSHCVSYMLTGNRLYEDNEQRCGCVVHLARQAVESKSGEQR